MGEHLPLHVQGPERLVAQFFTFGHDDDGDLVPVLVREIVEKGEGGAHEAAARTEALDVFVLPGDDVDDAGDGPGLGGVHAPDDGVGVGAAQELRVQHVRDHVVDAVFCYPGGDGARQPAGEVGPAHHPEILPLPVDSNQIGHVMRLL